MDKTLHHRRSFAGRDQAQGVRAILSQLIADPDAALRQLGDYKPISALSMQFTIWRGLLGLYPEEAGHIEKPSGVVVACFCGSLSQSFRCLHQPASRATRLSSKTQEDLEAKMAWSQSG